METRKKERCSYHVRKECRWTDKWVVIRCAWSAGGHTSGEIVAVGWRLHI